MFIPVPALIFVQTKEEDFESRTSSESLDMVDDSSSSSELPCSWFIAYACRKYNTMCAYVGVIVYIYVM